MSIIPDQGLLSELGLSRPLTNTASNKELDQDDFLMLMTTQLKNQDPFKPLENGDFIAQIAQFSAVTGITDLNTSFQSLAGSLSSNQALQAASMVGREVLVSGEHAELTENGSIKGAVDLPIAVNNLRVGIYDTNGQLVREIELGSTPSGMGVFDWDGLTNEGEAVPPGRYEIRAEATNDGTNEVFDVLIYAQVQSVTLPGAGGLLSLELAGLGSVNFSDVRQIR